MGDQADEETPEQGGASESGRRQRKQVLLRLDPAVHAALSRWAADELRSVNAQIELVLRRALAEQGRAPAEAGALPQRGRPRTRPADDR